MNRTYCGCDYNLAFRVCFFLRNNPRGLADSKLRRYTPDSLCFERLNSLFPRTDCSTLDSPAVFAGGPPLDYVNVRLVFVCNISSIITPQKVVYGRKIATDKKCVVMSLRGGVYVGGRMSAKCVLNTVALLKFGLFS